ncbi:hypothetical protein BKA70DRAFT_1418073 [Coprinopsis sp. MPI-PUGE-AT-0042]|nr:hypothetical protein BKA70DRAFT_1418073 [Coprinopsis sp. MPI-PUGE-AT-0042]
MDLSFTYPAYTYADSPASSTGTSSIDTFPDYLHPNQPEPSYKVISGPSKQQHTRREIHHPYARLNLMKDEAKRRKIWNHTHEKAIFRPVEMLTFESLGYWPVGFEELEPYKGLNSKTAKSKISGLQHDAGILKLKLLELERAITELENILGICPETQL